jgi:coenzyme PQQ precursor peptide PqqA
MSTTVIRRAPPAIHERERTMSWTTPMIDEVCIGMEVTSYQSAGV